MVKHMMASAGWGGITAQETPPPQQPTLDKPQPTLLLPHIQQQQQEQGIPLYANPGLLVLQSQPGGPSTLPSSTVISPLLAPPQSRVLELISAQKAEEQSTVRTEIQEFNAASDSPAGEETRWGYRVKRLSSTMRKMGLLIPGRPKPLLGE